MKHNEMTIDVEWLPGQGFLLWGADAHIMQCGLFGWHEPSFYGTFIPVYHLHQKTGVLASPITALEFFADQPFLKILPIQWGPLAQSLFLWGPALREWLTGGRWRPGFSKNNPKQMRWSIQWPPDEAWPDKNPPEFLEEWANSIIEELISRDVNTQKAWEALVKEQPNLLVFKSGTAKKNLIGPSSTSIDNQWLDEDEWLESIGWSNGENPWNMALQLIEPANSQQGQQETWTISVVLQDREQPDLVETLKDTLENAVSNAALSERLAKFAAKVERLVPSLDLYNGEQVLSEQEAWQFLSQDSLELAAFGVRVILPRWWEEVQWLKPRLKLSSRSSVGSSGVRMFGLDQIVQFDWKLSIGDTEISEEEFWRLAGQKSRLMRFRDQWIQLDPRLIQQVRKIFRGRGNGLTMAQVLQMHFLSPEETLLDDDLAFVKESATLKEKGNPDKVGLDDNLGQKALLSMEVAWDQQLFQLLSTLERAKDAETVEAPKSFQGKLRHYQLSGVSWLLFLRQYGLGSCLADDMGLGKTIQFLAYLSLVKENNISTGPSMLICPMSVLGNWQKEIQRFLPDLKIYLHYGSQRARNDEFLEALSVVDLVMTTYGLAYQDEAFLTTVNWDIICLDEAQNIKNVQTKQSQAVRQLQGMHRIALTGTPMENRLTELWSIMDFLNPGYLGSLAAFSRKFAGAIERNQEKDTASQLRNLVRPFLLRRSKSDPKVELDLPEKQELKEFVALTPEQASLYETVVRDLFEKVEEESGMARRGAILGALTRLKQICNHPALILKDNEAVGLQERSQKLERLISMVAELRAEGDQCLIFTQFIGMGEIIQQVLEQELGQKSLFLHGGTPKAQRDEMIARFQDKSLPEQERCPILILSLKAGGVGLNLTAANHVFHYDRWWNPAVENQATDRAHRIGQQRHVLVHKFIAMGSLEERIDEMLERKQGINDLIVGSGENWITELSPTELRQVLALRRQWID